MRYVLYTFNTGHSRLEPITPDRPVEVVLAELTARWGTKGRATVARDITEHIRTEPVGTYGFTRSTRFM